MIRILILFLVFLKATDSLAWKEFPDSVKLHIAKDNINCYYGLKDYQNEWVLKPEFDYISKSDGEPLYFILEKKGKKGLIRIDGRLYTEPQFDDIRSLVYVYEYQKESKFKFSYDDYFVITQNKLLGLFCAQGSEITITPQFKSISLDEEFAIVTDTFNQFGAINSAEIIIKPRYDYLSVLGNDKFVYAYRNNLKGVININNEILVKAAFDEIRLSTWRYDELIWGINGKSDKSDTVTIHSFDGKKRIQLNNYRIDFSQIKYSAKGLLMVQNSKNEFVFNSKGDSICTGIPGSYKLIENNSYFTRTNGKAAIVFIKDSKSGLMDEKGEVILKPLYDALIPHFQSISDDFLYECNFISIKNNKYGLISETGKTKIGFKYDLIFTYRQTLMLIRKGKLEFRSKKSFNKVEAPYLEFNNGLAFTYVEDESNPYNIYNKDCNCGGVINDKYEVLLMPKYFVSEFVNGKASFSNHGELCGYIYSSGKIEYTNKESFIDIHPFGNGYAQVVSHNLKSGIIDINYNLIVDTIFDCVSSFDVTTQTAWVKHKLYYLADSGVERDYGYTEYDFLYGSWGLMNQNGKLILDTVFDCPGIIKNDKVVLSKGGRFGIMHINGSAILPFEYNSIFEIDDQLYIIQQNLKYGLANSLGRIVLDTLFEDISFFHYKIAFGLLNNRMYLISKNGRFQYLSKELLNSSKINLYDSMLCPDSLINENFKYYYNFDDFHLFDSIPASTYKTFLLNDLFVKKAEYLMLNDEYYFPEYSLSDIYYATEYQIDFYDNHGWEETDFEFEIISYNNLSVSLIETIVNSGWMYTNMEHEFVNYALKGDSLKRITVESLFESDCQLQLKSAFFAALAELDDPTINCKNLDDLFESMKENFSISKEGLIFYINPSEGNTFSSDEEPVKVLIEYQAIASIIHENSVLREFLN